MKRKISVFLMLAMIASLLFGCTSNEIAFTEITREIGNITSYDYEITANIDLEELYNQISKTDSDYKGFLTEEQRNCLAQPITIRGSADCSGKSVNDIYISAEASFDNFEKNKFSLVISEGNLYLSKNIISAAVNTWGKGFYCTEFFDELMNNEEISNCEYIKIENIFGEAENMDISKVVSSAERFQKDIYDIAQKFLKNYSTGMITKSGNKYIVSITAENAINAVDSLLEYINNNIDSFEETCVKIISRMNTYYEEIGLQELAASEFEMTDENKQILKEQIASIKEYISENKNDMIENFGNSRLNYSVEKNRKMYTVGYEVIYSYQGNDYKVLTVSSNIKKNNSISKVNAGELNSLKYEIFKDIAEKIDRKNNAIESAEICWEYGGNTAFATYVKHSCINEVYDDTYTDQELNYIIEDGRIYLPLRAVCESMGLKVDWNQEQKQAYVTINGKTVPMDGILINGKTYIKIRDFEKLGYTVEYEQYENKNYVYIDSNFVHNK